MHQKFKQGPQVLRLKSPLVVEEGEVIGIMGLNLQSGLGIRSLHSTKYKDMSKRMSLI